MKKICMAVGLLTIVISPAASDPVRYLNLRSLVKSADVIVVGRVSQVIAGRDHVISLNANEIAVIDSTALLKVDDLLKGEIPGDLLSVGFYTPPAPMSEVRPLPKGQYGIFFLRRREDTFIIADLAYPFLPALPGRYRQKQPLDSVVAALAQVLLTPTVPDEERLRAMDTLARARIPLATKFLVAALNQNRGEMQLLIAAALVGSGEIAGLPVVENALLQHRQLPRRIISILGGSLAGLKNPEAIPSLSRLLVVKHHDVRLGVATALRQTQSHGAVSPLSKLLEDPDPLVTYLAVVGLGEITGQDEWTPSIDAFENNRAYYLAYWRGWSASNVH